MMAQPYNFVSVRVGNQQVKVKVDTNALVSPDTLPLVFQPLTGKVKIQRRGGTNYTLGSLPEQLYGSSYRFARHTANDLYDLRRSAFTRSQTRLNRMTKG